MSKRDYLYDIRLIIICDQTDDSEEFVKSFCRTIIKELKTDGDNDMQIYSGKIFKDKLAINTEVFVLNSFLDFSFY